MSVNRITKRGKQTPEGLDWPTDKRRVQFVADKHGRIVLTPGKMKPTEWGPEIIEPLHVDFDDISLDCWLNPELDDDARKIALLDRLIDCDSDLAGNYVGIALFHRIRRAASEKPRPFPRYDEFADADALIAVIEGAGYDPQQCLDYELGHLGRPDVIEALEALLGDDSLGESGDEGGASI